MPRSPDIPETTGEPPAPTKRRRATPRVWLLRLGIIALVSAGLLEGTLQIAAYNVWRQHRSAELRSEGDGPVVLCIGDSMTYGMGAASPKGCYPQQLERILRERDGRSWVVINGGLPGRDSRTVLQVLPDQLQNYRPDYVCVLVGINDQWTRGARVTDLAFDGSFPVLWRTGRLIDLMLAGRLDRYEGDKFIGVWHRDRLEVRFESNGRLTLGTREYRWLVREGKLLLLREGEQELEIVWRIKSGRLHLTSPLWKAEHVLDPGPPESLDASNTASAAKTGASRTRTQNLLAVGYAELRDSHHEAAVASFETALAQSLSIDEQASARTGLIEAHVQSKNPSKADVHLDWFRAQTKEEPSNRLVHESLAHGLLLRDSIDEAIQVSIRLVQSHPESLKGWALLYSYQKRIPSRTSFLDMLSQAVERLPPNSDLRRTLFLVHGMKLRQTDPDGFLRCMFMVLLGENPDELFVSCTLYLNRGILTTAIRDRVLTSMRLKQAVQDRLRDVFDRSVASDGGVRETLAAHLTMIVEVCRKAGAEPLMLDYPFREPDHMGLVDALAATAELRRVKVRSRFVELLQTKERDELFAHADMHCKDAGYGVIARLVATVLLNQ